MSNLVKPSELKSLLQRDGTEIYKWKGFLRGGCFPEFLLETVSDKKEVVGKIVPSPTEGELKHWPKVSHPNLNRLLDTINLEHDVKIFIAPVVGECIGNVIRDDSFTQHPLCFFRKRQYARGILLGLDYVHYRSTYILNISDSNVRISSDSDEAVICDFSCTVNRKRVPQKSVPSSILFKPPEIRNAKHSGSVDCVSIDMWACGVLLLQIFTQYLLPWDGKVINALQSLDCEVLRKANIGSCLQIDDLQNLKIFLQNFLSDDPKSRWSAEQAYKSNFLQVLHSRLDEPARHFWKSCEESMPCPSLGDSCFMDDRESVYSEVDMGGTSETHLRDITPNNNRSKSETFFLSRAKSEPRDCGARCNRLSVSLTNLKHVSSEFRDAVLSGYEADSMEYLNQMEDSLSYESNNSTLLRELMNHGQAETSPHLTEWEAASSVENTPNGGIRKALPNCHSQVKEYFSKRRSSNENMSKKSLPLQGSHSTVDSLNEEYLLSCQKKIAEDYFSSPLDGIKKCSAGTPTKDFEYSLNEVLTASNSFSSSSQKNVSVGNGSQANVSGLNLATGEDLDAFFEECPEIRNYFTDASSLMDNLEHLYSQERIFNKPTGCSSSSLESRHSERADDKSSMKIVLKEIKPSKRQKHEDNAANRLGTDKQCSPKIFQQSRRTNRERKVENKLGIDKSRSPKMIFHQSRYTNRKRKVGNRFEIDKNVSYKIFQESRHANREEKVEKYSSNPRVCCDHYSDQKKMVKRLGDSSKKRVNHKSIDKKSNNKLVGNNSSDSEAFRDDSSKRNAYANLSAGTGRSSKVKTAQKDHVVNYGIRNKPATNEDPRSRIINNSLGKSKESAMRSPEEELSVFENKSSHRGEGHKSARRWYHRLCLGCQK